MPIILMYHRSYCVVPIIISHAMPCTLCRRHHGVSAALKPLAATAFSNEAVSHNCFIPLRSPKSRPILKSVHGTGHALKVFVVTLVFFSAQCGPRSVT